MNTFHCASCVDREKKNEITCLPSYICVYLNVPKSPNVKIFKSCALDLFVHLCIIKCIKVKCFTCTQKIIRSVSADLPSLDIPQHLGKLDGMQNKSDDINMATVPSVTYLMRKHISFICISTALTKLAS